MQLFSIDVINNGFIYKEGYAIWFFGTLITLTIFLKSPKALSVNNSFKKNWLLLIINTLIAVIFVLIISKKNGSEMMFLFVPTTIIIANGFEVIQKNIYKNILFGLLFIGTIVAFFSL